MSRLLSANARTPFPCPADMTAYKNAQQHLVFNGRHFHFVSYDAQPANIKRGVEEIGPMWYLMGPNKRWPVMPHVLGQPEDEVATGLKGWIKAQGLAGA